MCPNFTYVVVGQRRRQKAIKKIVPQNLNVILIFEIEFFKYFFRVLHEASSSWVQLCWFILGHPIRNLNHSTVVLKLFTSKRQYNRGSLVTKKFG
jgi:hypothetical protein